MELGQGLEALAFFGFLTVMVGLKNRKEAREAFNRQEIYRKMLDSPGGSVEAVRAFMQQDEDRLERREIDRWRLGGMAVTAMGVGLTIFLYGLEDEERIYPLGFVPLFVGIVLLINASVLARRRRRDVPPT